MGVWRVQTGASAHAAPIYAARQHKDNRLAEARLRGRGMGTAAGRGISDFFYSADLHGIPQWQTRCGLARQLVNEAWFYGGSNSFTLERNAVGVALVAG